MNIKIDTTTEKINSTGGLILAGKIAEAIGLHIKSAVLKVITHFEVIICMFGLLVQGRTSFEEISIFRNDPIFKRAFDLRYVPAKETLRLYLNIIATILCIVKPILKSINMNLLKKVKISAIDIENRKYTPVDIDVSPFDNSKSNKEGVSRTYKGFDGYAPIFSYIGSEGYMLDCELREGKQHCQNQTPEFIKQNIKQIKKLNIEGSLVFRLDSGNDSLETLIPLIESPYCFIIKRNQRKEDPNYWLDTAKAMGVMQNPREGKYIYTGIITKSHSKFEFDTPVTDIVFRVVERFSDREGNQYLFPQIEVETYWTNMYEQPKTIIELYHDHGTSEQFHSELKTDMDVERLPSGKMAVNALILQIAMLAFNTLRFIGQTAMDKKEIHPVKVKSKRKRLRKVISDLILIGCKVVLHSRQFIIRIWNKNPWLQVFLSVYNSLSTI